MIVRNKNIATDDEILFWHKKILEWRDKIKCLFWDRNGFVLYYKRLDKCKFKIREMFNNVEMISGEDLEIMLSGFEPKPLERIPLLLEG